VTPVRIWAGLFLFKIYFLQKANKKKENQKKQTHKKQTKKKKIKKSKHTKSKQKKQKKKIHKINKNYFKNKIVKKIN
jgi:Flp pilus assembly protein TadB